MPKHIKPDTTSCEHDWKEEKNLIGGWEAGEKKVCQKCSTQIFPGFCSTSQPKTINTDKVSFTADPILPSHTQWLLRIVQVLTWAVILLTVYNIYVMYKLDVLMWCKT